MPLRQQHNAEHMHRKIIRVSLFFIMPFSSHFQDLSVSLFKQVSCTQLVASLMDRAACKSWSLFSFYTVFLGPKGLLSFSCVYQKLDTRGYMPIYIQIYMDICSVHMHG